MIVSRRIIHSLIALVTIGLAGFPFVIHAQTATQLIINYPELTDLGDDGLQIDLYFTIVDSTGHVVTDAQVQSAKILLDDGEVAENVAVEQPTTPFYIALVLDASGSMSPAGAEMRDAAIQAINDAPQEARFAVIRFNENINLLQDFTEDRGRATNAIGQVQPVNLSGTCLYDAAYEAIGRVSQAPPGRRAVIVFTDGTDEVAQPEGQPCSSHTFTEVVSYASSSRVPVHTIGLTTAKLNPTELKNMAAQTGGLSAVGEQGNLGNLFQGIMDALKSQWLAQAVFFPTAGPHAVTLIVTLDDGTILSASTTIQAPRDFARPETPTPTPTPVVVDMEILSVRGDVEEDLVYLEVRVQGEQVIHSYRFDFFDDNNQLLDSHLVPKPLPAPVALAAVNLDGKVRVELRALDSSGNFIEWPGERDRMIDKVTYEFTFMRPTPTPPPATFTPIPVGVELNSIAYDPETDIIMLDLTLVGVSQMAGLQVNVVDAKTNQLKTVYNTDVAETVSIGAEGLEPLKDYVVQVIAQSPTGQNLTRSERQAFTYTPPLTPTPVPTVTPTVTPTLEPITISVAVSQDEETKDFVFVVETNAEDRIDSFKLQLRNKDGLVTGEYIQDPPMRIPELEAGEYTAVVTAYGPQGNFLADGAVTFAYSPPPTPTATPTPAPTFTPTPTPAPGFIEEVTNNVRDNPILALVVGVIGAALVVVLILMIRPRKKAATGTGFLAEQTGFYQMPSGEAGGKQADQERPAAVAADAPPTNVMGFGDEMTDVFEGPLDVLAVLQINRSPALSRTGPTIEITSIPFRIGRGKQQQNDLSLDEDTSVSRSHAVITAEGGRFFITDQGSANGTRVGGVRITPQEPYPLHDGVVVMVGKGTEFTFFSSSQMESGPGSDLDKTDYLGPDDYEG